MTTPIEAHHVKKGSHIMLKGRPCKIADVKTSKTGKHGHAKCNITGIDVLTQKKYNDVAPGHIIFNAFQPDKKEYDVMDIDEKEHIINCLDENGESSEFPYDDDQEATQKLIADFKEKGGETTLSVTILTAPVGEGDAIKNESIVLEHKEIKD